MTVMDLLHIILFIQIILIMQIAVMFYVVITELYELKKKLKVTE